VDRIFEITDRLHKFPFSGRVVPEIGDEMAREIICGSYRIMYRVEENDIWITGVLHGARDIGPG